MQKKCNFVIAYKFHNFEARTMFLFVLWSESLALQVLWNTSCDFGFVFFLYIFLKIHIYFQKSTHISYNISESQNAIHDICRVGDSERYEKKIVLASKL